MVIQISFLFALAAMIFWGFGDFFIQKTTRKIGDVEALAYIGMFGSIALSPLIIRDFHLLFSLPNLLLLFFLGVITFIGALFNFEALKEGKLSIIDVILELELPVAIILSIVFLKEALSIIQIIIILFIFLAIVLMATKSFSHWKTRLEKGVIYAIIGAIGMGVIDFLTGISSQKISPLMAIWLPWIIVSLLCIIFILRREGINRFVKNGIKFKYIILAMSIFDTLAWLFYAFALSKNEISLITAITESYPAIALFLAVWLNKEKIRWYQYLGAIIALSFSFILAVTAG